MTTEDHCWWGKFVVLFWGRKKSGRGCVAIMLKMHHIKMFYSDAACISSYRYTKFIELHVQITQYCVSLNLTVWSFIRPKMENTLLADILHIPTLVRRSDIWDVSVRCQAVFKCFYLSEKKPRKTWTLSSLTRILIFQFLRTLAMSCLAGCKMHEHLILVLSCCWLKHVQDGPVGFSASAWPRARLNLFCGPQQKLSWWGRKFVLCGQSSIWWAMEDIHLFIYFNDTNIGYQCRVHTWVQSRQHLSLADITPWGRGRHSDCD